jgi:ribonuclease VapC
VSERFVLDASALLCLLNGEAGADRVAEALPEAIISTVNLSEVIAKLSDAGGSPELIRAAIDALQLRIITFDEEQARMAGLLRPATRAVGLSFGDRACLALGRIRKAIVLTADGAWSSLDVEVIVEPLR